MIAVDNGSADNSAMTARLKAARSLIDIGPLSDDVAAQKIRDAEIDILVNLNGWFGRPRICLAPRRTAAGQLSGVPGTLGAPYIDSSSPTASWSPQAKSTLRGSGGHPARLLPGRRPRPSHGAYSNAR
ncbi:MAG: hypothetical protein U1E93_12760 [Alphaproteobacteria bacterium]